MHFNGSLRLAARLGLIAALGLPAIAFTGAGSAAERGSAPVALRAGFGRAVAAGNGEVLVGEPENMTRPGIVYVYRKGSNGQWSIVGRLTAPDGSIGDQFGSSLALDGHRLIVGAFNTTGPGGAHIFERGASGEWRHVQTFAQPEGAIGFGLGVAIRGNWAVVTAPLDGGSMVDGGPGAAYVFRRDASGAWTPAGKLVASDATPQSIFGVSVALDGTRMLVGSARSGVYAFHFDGSQWRETGKVSAEGAEPQTGFGSAVRIAGDRAYIGAPGYGQTNGRVWLFRVDPATNTWTSTGRLAPPDTTTPHAFGNALSLDGNQLLIGASNAGRVGAAFLFRNEGGDNWRLVAELRPESAERNIEFGGSLAIHQRVAAVGMTGADFGAGRAAIHETTDGNTWTSAGSLIGEDESLDPVTGGEVRCNQGKASIFPCSQVDLISFLPIKALGGKRGVHLNDIWGWTDPQTGKEYALVGRVDGTAFVDISKPEQPVYVGELPLTEGATPNAWRDIKVYKDHAYIVADGAGPHGMQVFDLTRLREYSGTPITFKPDTTYDRIASAHNIVINEESGFAYTVGNSMGGQTCGGGLHMVDIRDPEKPVFAGCFSDALTGRAGTGYTHDAQCVTYKGPDADYQGREICVGANETAISIADVTDKKNPKAIARAPYPNVGYTHQGWFTDDHRYFLVDDELDEVNGSVNRTRTLVWDLADLDDPQLVKEYLGETAASDHNLYVKGNLVFESNYASGLRVLDITDPLNPREVGHLDVLPFGEDKPGFTGSWSNYPYFRSGVIAVTGIEQGLFLVRYRPTRPVS